ncbi:hydrocephalus-inducing protein homolog isoform X2 [Xyrichtys novacula]|uniref:Hydrocephalus-inducing protein homolog isoform X2 n=1 Tax=Xyrichtys novacula TaxID=13765 RepID=A0AAV1F943_XYRNO|nr:hydrocephalus-inducing protein homolog isoform X2 [Xyrichtys novacula]
MRVGVLWGVDTQDEQSSSQSPPSVEEIFDILPVYGHLQPGEEQLVTFSFYGHKDLQKELIAQCQVEEGPAYEIRLKGKASAISYSLDSSNIDFGVLLFDHVGEAEVTLRNTGKMGFKFIIIMDPQTEDEEDAGDWRKALRETEQQSDTWQQEAKEKNEKGQVIRPGQPVVIPNMGYIESDAEQCLRILYLPGVPEVFKKQLQLQVAFLPLQDITLSGEGVFPRISLGLPQNLANECYSDVMQQASASVEADRTREEPWIGNTSGGEVKSTQTSRTSAYEEPLLMEVERMLVKQNALAVMGGLLELSDSQSSLKMWRKLSKFALPEYILDFGFIILGRVPSHTVKITNNGSVAVSFHANLKYLAGTGFSADFERVKNLPCSETHSFTIKFDPEGAKLKLGHTSVVMPIQVAGGPMVQLRLCAVVTLPAVTASTDTLQFDTLQCGMCQMKTIQLINHESVPCHWSIAEEVKPFKKVDKFLPLYQRKKALQEQRPPPAVFEMVPNSGMLSPGEIVNVQVKFSPVEGQLYNRQLIVHVAESNKQVFIKAQGQAEEPKLQFCPSVIELEPCLPLSTECEATVTVKNPCSFPIEFYSLEFDTQYLEEEKILSLMQGYDENNMLLLPPRAPGDNLPVELLDYYKEYCSQLKEDELKEGPDKSTQRTEEINTEERESKQNNSQHLDNKEEDTPAYVKPAELFISEMTRAQSRGRLEHLEMSPVSRAIARHMCIDLSPEGLAARNRRGIAIIVYGAPLTDKTSTAAALAHYYEGAILTVDGVVTHALTNSTSPVSLSARQLLDSAAAEYAKKKAKEAARALTEASEPAPKAHVETSNPAPHSSPPSHDAVEALGKPIEDGCCKDDTKDPKETEILHLAQLLGGDVTTLSNLLPEQLLEDILAERFQLSDCYRGIVMDGLDSLYTQSASRTLQVVLKALNNRKHIYVVDLSDSYDALKARERAQRETNEVLLREKSVREKQWLQELDEEEYETLPEEEKEQLGQQLRESIKQRQQRKLKQIEKELEEKRLQMQKLKEEELKVKSKKGGKKDMKETVLKSSLEGRKSADTPSGRRMSYHNSKESLLDPKEHHYLNEGHHIKEEGGQVKHSAETKELQSGSPKHTEKLQKETPCVDQLQSQFTAYEQSQKQVENILQHWDRVQGLLLYPVSDETLPDKQTPVGRKNRKANRTMSPIPSRTAEAKKTEDQVSSHDIIPHIVLSVTGKDCPSVTELLNGNTLPPLEEVLDDLGLGPSGPVVPPPVTFSLVPFPKKREQWIGPLTCDCFNFLVPSGLDQQDKEKGYLEEDEQASVVKEKTAKSWGSVMDNPARKNREEKGRESQRSKRRTSAKTKAKDQHQEKLQEKCSQRLTTFRWVVPANGEVYLKISFYSESPGKFEQIFNFELVGIQRSYQLISRGICTYPSICKDYRTLFTQSKTVQQVEEGPQRAYIIKPGFFEFGPLLCGKTRDRYKENRYPENTVRIEILNNYGLEAEVQFSFQHDTQATTYLLDPPTTTLKPGQIQELTVWAYPTKVGQIEDSIVCNIKDNPEPVIINLSCWGVRPELELEHKHLHFDRILLHRPDSRTLTMRNKTALPVSWRLKGVEKLGDTFDVLQDQGIISPNSSSSLSLHFKASKPVLVKNILRLEVSDVEKIVGVLQTENIQVTAEAYDITLNISPDGCLNFGTIKVFEEAKLCLMLKNKGKYKIAYKFTFQQTDPAQPTLDSMFTVTPQSGSLLPNEKATTVQITCRPTTELSLKEQPILPCQVIEPNFGKGGEIITILAIKVSVQALFSRYEITPACDMVFGPLVYGGKKRQSFTIENTGVFETHYTLSRMITDPASPGRPGGPARATQESLLGKPTGASCRGMRPTQDSLTMGVFSVSPRAGTIQPGSQQVVIVDCQADQLGSWSQFLCIDISDRDPSDKPDGIPYRLMAEVFKPGIALDTASIFEEHHLCTNSSQLSSEQFCDAKGIYVRDENKFVFNKVLVGQTAEARFKFTNNSKVPCVLSMAIRYVSTKTPRTMKVFDLPTTTLSIPSQSHSFAVVTFAPQTMQLYSAVFEATLEGISRMTPTSKNKVLEFELMGEGNLSSVCVVRPALRNNQGNPMLHFRRAPVERRQTLPLVLLNDGNIPAQVHIDMLDKHQVFTLRAAHGNTLSSIHSTVLKGTTSEHGLVHRATLRLNTNEHAEFEVSFCTDKPLSVKAKMSLQVEDNQYANTIISVTGEAYREVVSLDNISKSLREMDQEDEEIGYYEELNFGDCHVNVSHQESFTMTNHSSSQVVRFEWPSTGPHVSFSPQVGHLHTGCSKEVTITFCSSQPVTLTSQPMTCKLCQVAFQQPLDQVADWDDRQRTVQWQTPQQSVKNKVVKTDPEPCCTVVEGSQWELELRVSAICDYVKFSCIRDTIHFKDTMLYQTRTHQLQMVNHGDVKLEFSWQVVMDPRNTGNLDQGGKTLTARPGSASTSTVSGARSSSALASVMSLMMQNPEHPPFSIEPTVGTIQPAETETFSIRFSPLEVVQFQGRLLCSIPNLHENDQAPCISVCGQSLFPHYHINLEDSDYITRRNPEFRAHLEPNIRVVELNAVGFSAPSSRCFTVMNPTSKPYSFKWRCEDTGDSPFRCLTPCGTILPGKKVEVCFEYVAEQLDTVESFWSFVIETLSLSVPFLCVGTAREPVIYLDRPHLDFGELLVGRKVEHIVYVINGEEEPFHYSILPSSLVCDDQESALVLQPMTGTIAPKDRLPMSVSFTPCREGCVSFKLVLRVKRKSELLTFPVKASCFTISVQVGKPNEAFREAKADKQDSLDFGEVEILTQSTLNLLVSHPAKFSLGVSFDLAGPCEVLQHLEAKPENATLEFRKQLQTSLIFSPKSICNLEDVRLSVKVKHGPKFVFALKGRVVTSSLQFSFTKYNFGKCFLYCPDTVPTSKTLIISNKSKRDISVQFQYKTTSYLEVDFRPDILSPGAMMEVPVRFYPREACHYHEKLIFILNSSIMKQVDILGQGIERKLEVKDPKHRKLKLGSLMVGQKVKKQVTLVNRSPLDLSFTLLLNTNTALDQKDLSFSPTRELVLKAKGGSCDVEIQFSPRQQVPLISAELQAQFPGLFLPLLTIQGCCKVVEVQLDQDHLAFGAVVQGCQARKRIVMRNIGDIGARFQWKTDSFPPELSIAPAKGYISPDKEVPLEVTFAPVELNKDTRYENVICNVEGFSSPVTLTVTGSCIIASTSKEVVNFVCPVRRSHTQTLPVFNPTNQHCCIKPVIEGEQWGAEPSINFEPLQNKTYKITYKPLTMTADKKKHLGSVFFSFPDGSGMLYSLQGTAEPPKAEDTILHELPAKTYHTQMIPVHNWLSKQQRFRVLMEILNPDKTDATVSLSGFEYIDVPSLSKRDYKMSFYTYKEGQFNTKVTFQNRTSGEYLFYLVSFKVTSSGVISTIKLETTVRRMIPATVQVENPLTTPTCLSTECSSPDISAPNQYTVPGQSKSSLSFEYLPLHAGESTARLTLNSPDLGYFHYDLVLRAQPPPTENTVHFSTSLGSSHSVLIKFTNYSRFRTEYSCKTNCPDFTVDEYVSAAPGSQVGSEACVEVRFEPHQQGEMRGQLTLSSGIGGEYIFPLLGICLPPKPQGPFSIKAGRSITIPFKNVFLHNTSFSCQVDNPCFIVKGVDTVLSKKTDNILVSFDASSVSSAGPWYGRLTITSQRSECHKKPCSWVYYLKGNRPESS